MVSFGFRDQTRGRPSVPIRFVRAAALALLVGFVNLTLVSPAFGQGAGASIEGIVKDQQGGVLPGATVTLRNVDSGVTRTSTTQADGRYRFLALAPGRYKLSSELSGFATKESPEIPVNIGLSVTQDLTMGLQAVQESVTVTGEAPTIDTTKSEVAGVVTQQQIQNLPVNSRQFLNLALLMPGTSQDASRSFYNNVSIGAGTSYYSNGFLVDGVNNTWAEQGEPRQNFPQGAVQEFKVNTVGFPAEFGLATGGLVQVVTKSGSNKWSGEAFEYFRDKSLNAVNIFEEKLASKPEFRRNQYGASFGGPIVKDRTHFFLSIEHTKTDQALTVNTGKPQFYGALEGSFPQPITSTMFVGRLDHQINQDQTLFFRFGAEGGKKTCLGCGGTSASNAGFDFQKPAHSSVVGHTWVVSPRMLNEIRFQYAYAEYQVIPGGQQPFTTVGDYPPDRISLSRIQRALYLPSLSYGNGFDEIGPEKRYQFKDTLTFSREKQAIKVGVDFSDIPFADDALYNLNGYYVFGTDQFLDGSAQSIANLKNPVFFGASVPAQNSSLPTQHLALFVQDTWRPSSRLTVDIGLRYDRQYGSFNENITLDPRVIAAVQALGSTANNKSRGDKNNFGPRLGMVWDARGNGNSVVRAGFGVYYDNIRTLNNMIGEQRNYSQFSIAIVNPAYPDPYQGKDPLSFAQGGPANLNVLADNFRNPQAENYTVGMTQKLSTDVSINVDVVRVNTQGDRVKYDLNLPNAAGVRPLPNFGFVDQDRSVNDSDYTAMYVRLDKRLSHHYQYLISYTGARANDCAPKGSNGGGFFHVTNQANPSLDCGPSDNERRNTLVASGTVVFPWDITVGAVYTYRSALPFNAMSGSLYSADGQQQYVPGTSRDQGNRDLSLSAVNAWRAQNGLASISESQIQSDRVSTLDVRFGKAIRLSGQGRLELLAQVFNILGTDNLNAPFSGGQVINSLSASFGQILTAKNRQQGELAVRLVW
jgi:Carboxypeptidase regulatory-like domain/TonB dependent receptor